MLRFLIGLVVLLIGVGGAYWGVRSLRRATMPQWTGASGALVDAVGMITVVILVTQLLGLLAVYGVVTMLATLLAVGYGASTIATLLQGRVDVPLASAVPDRLGRPGTVLATLAVAAGLGPWIVRSAVAFSGGVQGADTLWYHLPSAAKLAQSGSLRQIEYFDADPLTAYYPVAATFFHSIGMLFLENDILSPTINLAWTALALLACWMLGRPFGLQSATVVAGVVSLSFPGFVGHNGGSAMNDIVATALVLAALAILVNADTTRLTTSLPAIALAGFATGAALGTKWTIIPATGAVTFAVLAAAWRGPWLRIAGTWLAASGSVALLTYVRNLIVVGNPLPPNDIRFGPIGFDSVREAEGVASIASSLFRDGTWNAVYHPGLQLWFGPLWWLAIAVAVIGLVVGLATGPGLGMRIVAFTGLVSAAGYLLMPQNLEVFGGPNYFLSNARYGVIALTIGYISLVVSPLWSRNSLVRVAPALMLLLLISSLATSEAWTGVDDWRYQDDVASSETIAGVIGAGVIALGGLAIVWRRDLLRPLTVGAAALALLAGVVFSDAYLDGRYADPAHEAHVLEDARIAVSGTNVQYMYYGRDVGNHVQYVGKVADGLISAPATCEEWITGVVAGDYTHVVVGVIDPSAKTLEGPYLWTSDQPATTLIRDTDGSLDIFTGEGSGNVIALFSVDGPLDPSRCAG